MVCVICGKMLHLRRIGGAKWILTFLTRQPGEMEKPSMFRIESLWRTEIEGEDTAGLRHSPITDFNGIPEGQILPPHSAQWVAPSFCRHNRELVERIEFEVSSRQRFRA